jgi:hypothetical protein
MQISSFAQFRRKVAQIQWHTIRQDRKDISKCKKKSDNKCKIYFYLTVITPYFHNKDQTVKVFKETDCLLGVFYKIGSWPKVTS